MTLPPVLLNTVNCVPTAASAGKVQVPAVQYTYEPLCACVRVVLVDTVTTSANWLSETFPFESPVIQTGLPSPDDMESWSSASAVTSAFPITTLLEPVVILSPAS